MLPDIDHPDSTIARSFGFGHTAFTWHMVPAALYMALLQHRGYRRVRAGRP